MRRAAPDPAVGPARHGAQAGVSLVEVLVALTVCVIVLSAVSSTLVSSIRTDGATRSRTSVNTVAESWLDRYRANQEPYDDAGSACTGDTTSFTCTYPAGHNYATDSIYSHASSAALLAERFGPYRNVITGTRLNKGTNRELWEIRAQVRHEQMKQTVEAVTYVLH